MPRKSQKRPQESVSGTYAAVPHRVLDSPAYQGASDRAIRMLLELLRQHNGTNNGRLQLTVAWLKGRGWKSVDAIQKAKAELIERQLIIQTKRGGLGIGPDFYALTWLQISNFVGLDVSSKTYHPGSWQFTSSDPTIAKRLSPKEKAKESCSVHRNNNVPSTGTGSAFPVPSTGTVGGWKNAIAVPSTGTNVCTTPLPERLDAS